MLTFIIMFANKLTYDMYPQGKRVSFDCKLTATQTREPTRRISDGTGEAMQIKNKKHPSKYNIPLAGMAKESIAKLKRKSLTRL